MALVHEKIIAVMKEVGAVGKDSENTAQHFKFRSVDSVMAALHPLFAKHGLFCVPEVEDIKVDEREKANGGVARFTLLKQAYVFYAEDGSHLRAVVPGEGMDSGDKSANKAMAVALKYVLTQSFCIPTSDPKDPDAESPELGARTKAEVKKETPSAPAGVPAKPVVSHEKLVSGILEMLELENIDKTWFLGECRKYKMADDSISKVADLSDSVLKRLASSKSSIIKSWKDSQAKEKE